MRGSISHSERAEGREQRAYVALCPLPSYLSDFLFTEVVDEVERDDDLALRRGQ